MSPWTSVDTSIIKTPRGDYHVKSNDLKAEILAAANFASLRDFRVRVNGTMIETAKDLQTNSIPALIDQARIEGVEPAVEVGAHNKPG